jgi:hypothetical protein
MTDRTRQAPPEIEAESDALAEERPVNEGLRKLYVSCADGDFVVELPPGHRITFGAVNPGGNPQGMVGRELHCLRVWEGPGKSAMLRAVFCNVRGVRDLALPLARKVSKETGAASWHRDDLGNFEQSSQRHIEASWGDPLAEAEDEF